MAKHMHQSGGGKALCDLPFPPLRRTQVLAGSVSCGLRSRLKTHPCFTPRSPSSTPLPHTPTNFIAGLYYFQRTGARLPLVTPSLTPCTRPCEFMSLAPGVHPSPPPQRPILTLPTTPTTPHSLARYHIYRVCALLLHPHPCRTSNPDAPPGGLPTTLPPCPPPGVPYNPNPSPPDPPDVANKTVPPRFVHFYPPATHPGPPTTMASQDPCPAPPCCPTPWSALKLVSPT